jgi:hypothetical protein
MRTQFNLFWVGLLAAVLVAGGCVGGRTGAVGQPILSVSSQSVVFGDVAVGSTTILEVTFANLGSAPLALQQNSVSGSGFTTSGIGAGVTLAPGQYSVMAVNFNPSAAGNVSGAVSVSSNASSAPVSISLSGVGVVAGHSAALAWLASPSAVVGYNVYCSSDAGVSWTKVNSSPAATTEYTDWDAQGAAIYMFAVTAVNASNEESGFSNEVEAVISAP